VAEPGAPTPPGAPPPPLVVAPTPETLVAPGISLAVTPAPETLVGDLEALFVPGRLATVLAPLPVLETVLLKAPLLAVASLELPAADLVPAVVLALVAGVLLPTLPCKAPLSPEPRRPRAREPAEARELSEAVDASGAVDAEPE